MKMFSSYILAVVVYSVAILKTTELYNFKEWIARCELYVNYTVIKKHIIISREEKKTAFDKSGMPFHDKNTQRTGKRREHPQLLLVVFNNLK